MSRRVWVVLLVGIGVHAACSSGGRGSGVPAFGLSERVVVQGLQFPTGLARPGPMQALNAFPGLFFQRPVFLCAPPDGSDRIAVVEQDGLIRIFDNDSQVSAAKTFLDLSGVVSRASGEEGLLGLAFHPDHASNGEFYVYYSAASPRRSVISRWRVTADPDRADPNSEQILLEIAQPFANHNGGALAFGPDGMLYVSTGDGGSANDPLRQAQDLGSLLGKILRLAADGSVPPDNPFVGVPGARGEIWALGLRNPWRLSFDRQTGALWLGDVGQDAVEEVDRWPAAAGGGANFGWPIYEGERANVNPSGLPASAFVEPVHTYPHALGQSVTGGVVYRGVSLSSLFGAYVYADFVSGRVWALVHDGSQTIASTEIAPLANPTAFGEDEAGELYACSFDGGIYRFVENGGAGGGGSPPPLLSQTGLFTDLVTLLPTPGLIEYAVNAPLWSDGATKRRWLGLPGTSRIAFDPTAAWSFPVGTVLVKHFEIAISPGESRRLETRILLHGTAGWQGFTYRWNGAGTDADLLAQAVTENLSVTDPGGGPPRIQPWTYPAPADCLTCHTAAAGRVLGVRTLQLNRDFAYPLRADNQLRAWDHIGLFERGLGDPRQYGALPDPASAVPALAGRARAYLDANCAQCHRPAGPTPVDLDLRFNTPAAAMQLVGVPAANPTSPGARRVVPGSKESSELWQRLRRRDGLGMPPLGSHLIDDAAVALIGAWIDGQ